MKEQHLYADPELPFHVWVRETCDGKSRWVLRDASKVPAQSLRAAASRLGADCGASPRPPP